MSQGWVILGQLLRRSVLPGVLRFHRVPLRQGAQADQRPQQEPQCPQPAHQVGMHLSQRRQNQSIPNSSCTWLLFYYSSALCFTLQTVGLEILLNNGTHIFKNMPQKRGAQTNFDGRECEKFKALTFFRRSQWDLRDVLLILLCSSARSLRAMGFISVRARRAPGKERKKKKKRQRFTLFGPGLCLPSCERHCWCCSN